MRYTVNFIPGFDTTPSDAPDVEISVSTYTEVGKVTVYAITVHRRTGPSNG